MPPKLHPRKPRPISVTARVIVCVVVFLLILVVRSCAALADGAFDHHHMQMQTFPMPETPVDKPSYYGYMHERYHELFYSKLRKFDGGSCCSGYECRVTEALVDAPLEFKTEGYDKMVMVDGEWYPIKLREKMTGFTAEQIADAKRSPLYQEFLQQTHVCASRSVSRQAPFSGQTRHNFLKMGSAYIYCVVDGGVRM